MADIEMTDFYGDSIDFKNTLQEEAPSFDPEPASQNIMDTDLDIMNDPNLKNIDKMFEETDKMLDEAIYNPDSVLSKSTKTSKQFPQGESKTEMENVIESKEPEMSPEAKATEWGEKLEGVEMDFDELAEVRNLENFQSTLSKNFDVMVKNNTSLITRDQQFDVILEDGEVAEMGATETIPGMTETVEETSAILDEVFGASAEVGAEVDVAAAAIDAGTAAGDAALAAMGTAAAVVGAVAAVAGVALTVVQIVEEFNRVAALDETYEKYAELGEKMSRATTLAADTYNQHTQENNSFLTQYYKYVMPYTKFGPKWKRSEANVMPKFVFVNDYNQYKDEEKGDSSFSYDDDGLGLISGADDPSIRTKTGLRYHLAEMLNNGHTSDSTQSQFRKILNILEQKDAWGRPLLRGNELATLYTNVKKSYDFHTFIENIKPRRHSSSAANNAESLLGIRDQFLLDQFRNQSQSDPAYKRALIQYTALINKKRKEKDPSLMPLDTADVSSPMFMTVKQLSKDTTLNPKVDFWAIYFNANKRRFMKKWFNRISEEKVKYIKQGRRLQAPPEPTPEEIRQTQADYAQNITALTHEMEVGNNREYRDGHRIIRKGVSYHYPREESKPEKSIKDIYVDNILKKGFQRKKRKQDTEEKQQEEVDDEKDEKVKPKRSSQNTIISNINFRPEKENEFDRETAFSIDVAHHLAYLCNKAYEEASTAMGGEIEEGYTDVQFMGTEGFFDSTQGRMYWNEDDKAITIVYRGTDFTLEMDKMLSDAGIDAAAAPTTYLGMNVHWGFYHYFEKSLEQVLAFVDKYYNDDVVIYTTGHSLGAIPSVLLSACLNQKKKRTCCVNYNYGSPRGFLESSRKLVDDLVPVSFRIADINDIVAGTTLQNLFLMPWSKPYSHVGDAYVIESSPDASYATMKMVKDRKVSDSLFSIKSMNVIYHKMDHYIKSLDFIQNHLNAFQGSLRSEDNMIDSAQPSFDSRYKTEGKVLLSNMKNAFKKAGRQYQGKQVYHEIGAEHLEYLPQYYGEKGLMMTPIPTTMKDAIIGFHVYNENDFVGGEVKGFFLY